MKLQGLKQFLKLILKSSFILSLSACATKPPDKPLCKELSMTSAYCVDMISGRDYMVDDMNLLDGKTWWETRISVISMPSTTWGELKKYIIKTCKQYKHCDKEVSSWERTVENIDNTFK